MADKIKTTVIMNEKPVSVEVSLTKLESGEKNNDNALAGYQNHPENAGKALTSMLSDPNLVPDLVSAIFRETIGEAERDNIINHLTLFDAWKEISGNDAPTLQGTPTNDLFFATWVNYTCCSRKYNNVKSIGSYQALRDARVLCNLEGLAPLNYEDYMVSSDLLEGDTLDFMATNSDFSVKFMVRVPVVKVPAVFGDKFRIANDKAKGLLYPNRDPNHELVIPSPELAHMIEEKLKDRKKVRFSSEEAQRSLQDYVNTESAHIESIFGVNSYLVVAILGAENGLDQSDLKIADDSKVEVNKKGVYLKPRNEADVTGRGDIYDEDADLIGGVKITARGEAKYSIDSPDMYIIKISQPDNMNVISPQ